MSTQNLSKTQFTIQELAARWAIHPLIRHRIRRGEIRWVRHGRHGRQIVRVKLAEIKQIEKEARA